MITELTTYLILVTFWWGIFMLTYRHVLNSDGSLTQHRSFLIFTLLSGVLFPLIPWPIPAQGLLTYSLPEILISSEPIQTVQVLSSTFQPIQLLLLSYLIGVACFLILRLQGLYQLYRLRKSAERINFEGETIYFVPQLPTPFQFAGSIYFPEKLTFDKSEFQLAFIHEQAHRKLYHSLDLGVASLLQIIFWPHPLIYLIVKELRLVHEYQADQAVIGKLPRDNYVRFIGSFLNIQPVSLPIHTIIQGPIKKRIMNMYHSRQSLQFKHWAAITFTTLFLISLTAMREKEHRLFLQPSQLSVVAPDSIPLPPAPPPPPPAPPAPPAPISAKSKLPSVAPPSPPTLPDPVSEAPPAPDPLTIAKVMPRFPGCEHLGSISEKEECAQLRMMEYLSKNIQYPEVAKSQGIEGTCVASFVVEKDGSMSDIRIVKDIGGGTASEFLRLFEKMTIDGIRWIPGKKEGKIERMELSLPIKFKLVADKK